MGNALPQKSRAKIFPVTHFPNNLSPQAPQQQHPEKEKYLKIIQKNLCVTFSCRSW